MSAETLIDNKLSSIASFKTGNEVDLVRSYLRDIGRVPLLTHEQEITLGRQVQELMQVEKLELEIIDLTGEKPSVELTDRIDEALEKGRDHLRHILSVGRSEVDETTNSMLKSISDRLESIEKRLDS